LSLTRGWACLLRIGFSRFVLLTISRHGTHGKDRYSVGVYGPFSCLFHGRCLAAVPHSTLCLKKEYKTTKTNYILNMDSWKPIQKVKICQPDGRRTFGWPRRRWKDNLWYGADWWTSTLK
jgi:hypothetical protein